MEMETGTELWDEMGIETRNVYLLGIWGTDYELRIPNYPKYGIFLVGPQWFVNDSPPAPIHKLSVRLHSTFEKHANSERAIPLVNIHNHILYLSTNLNMY